MATVSEVARSALAKLNSSAGHLLAAQWINDRYRHVAARTKLGSLREIGELTVPAIVTAGTVTTTQGSRTVTGDATAAAAWSPALVGQAFRASTVWYTVEGISGTTLTLASAFAETAVTASSYTIAAQIVTLDPRARWLSDVIVHARRRLPIQAVSRDVLDQRAPGRPWASGSGAQTWAEVGDRVNADGRVSKAVELYPYSTTNELYYYVFYTVPATLGLDDALPPELDPHVLVEGVLIDAMRYEMSRMAQLGKIEAAALWRNEYRAQETRWERVILDAFRASSAIDDRGFLFASMNWMPVGDVMTARDDVWLRWST